MNKALRKAVIAGNWKMNKTPAEAKALLEEIKPLVKDAGCDVVVCVPYVDLCTASGGHQGHQHRRGRGKLPLGRVRRFHRRNFRRDAHGNGRTVRHHRPQRAPHLFRRDRRHRTTSACRAALDAGLTVILCVGEYLEQREQGVTAELVAMQTKIALRRRFQGRAEESYHRLRACLGHRHRQDRYR